jgi:superfamily II DNA or RNA helicase
MIDKIKIKYAELSDKIYINGTHIKDIEKFERAYSYILDDVTFYTYEYDEEEDIYSVPSNSYYKLDIEDYIDNRNFFLNEKDKHFTFAGDLRQEQQDVVDSFFKIGRVRSGLFQAPCGWGKTYAACSLISQADMPTLIIVHTKLLFKQWQQELEKLIPNSVIGSIGDGEFKVTNLTVGIYKSVHNNMEQIKNKFSLIFVDEAHLCPADLFSTTVNNINCKIKIAVTATPRRKDGKHIVLNDFFTPFRVVARDEKEHETPRIQVISTDVSFNVIEPKRDWSRQMNKVTQSKVLLSLIAKEATQDIANGRCLLILSERVDMLKTLQKMINKSVLLIGETGEEDRKDILKTAGSKYKAILSTKIFDEGISCHRLDTLYLTCPNNNPIKLEQRIGRIIREHPDKKVPLIKDFWFKGAIVNNQQRKRLAWYQSRNYIL